MVRLAVDKDDLGSAKHKGIGSGYKSIARENDFISRLDIQQNGCHLKCICAGSGEEAFLETITSLKEILAALGKFTITGDFAQVHRLLNVFQLVASKVGFVEWDFDGGFQLWGVGFQLWVVGCRLSVLGSASCGV
jgi:hypothetical protein